jgi:fatty acid desaturase
VAENINMAERDDDGLIRREIYRVWGLALGVVSRFLASNPRTAAFIFYDNDPKANVPSVREVMWMLDYATCNYLMAKGGTDPDVVEYVRRVGGFHTMKTPDRGKPGEWMPVQGEADWIVKETSRLCLKHKIFR